MCFEALNPVDVCLSCLCHENMFGIAHIPIKSPEKSWLGTSDEESYLGSPPIIKSAPPTPPHPRMNVLGSFVDTYTSHDFLKIALLLSFVKSLIAGGVVYMFFSETVLFGE